jgi:hypothetical protein
VTAPAVLVLTLTLDELRAVFRTELDAALAMQAPTSTQLLTLDGLAHADSCSRATIRRLVREGAPCSYLGQSLRFDLDQWRAWCVSRGRKATHAKPSTHEVIPGVRLLSRAGAR